MENGWISIYTTTSPMSAELCRQALEEAQIPAVVVNQRDSSFQSFGDIQVYVEEQNVEQAKKIAERFEN